MKGQDGPPGEQVNDRFFFFYLISLAFFFCI